VIQFEILFNNNSAKGIKKEVKPQGMRGVIQKKMNWNINPTFPCYRKSSKKIRKM